MATKKKTAKKTKSNGPKTEAIKRARASAKKTAKLLPPKTAAEAFEQRFEGIKTHIPRHYYRPTMAAIDRALKAQGEFIRAEVEKKLAMERMIEDKKGPGYDLYVRMVKALELTVGASEGTSFHFEQLVEEAKAFVLTGEG